MQQSPTNDYINWLRMQDSQLAMEEAQLAAEEWQLEQTIQNHNNNAGQRWGWAILRTIAKSDQPTVWQRQSFQLADKQSELQLKRSALDAKRIWIWQEKIKYRLP